MPDEETTEPTEPNCSIASFTAWEGRAKPTTVTLSLPGDEANDVTIELNEDEQNQLGERIANIGFRHMMAQLVERARVATQG